MSAYRALERKAAQALESLPWLRNSVKTTYHRLNYLYFRREGFRSQVHPAARLLSAEEWLGAALPPEQGIFFGYYDKSPWCNGMRQVVLHRARSDGNAEVLVLDGEEHSCRSVGLSAAWNYQQGAMAQWLPGQGGMGLIFNDWSGGDLVARIVGPDGAQSTVPMPVQAIHPSRPEALSLNYRRLARLRSEYGYRVDAANLAPDQPADRDGLWTLDLLSGEHRLLASIAQLAAYEPRAEMQRSEHLVNHALYSPAGTRFVFLHRWLGPRGKFSRLWTAGSDGQDLRLLLDYRMISHFNWLDEDRLLVWARAPEAGDGYYVLDVNTGARQPFAGGALNRWGDGHPSLSPDRRWLVTDSYPDRAREQRLVVYRMKDAECIEVGRFFAPWRFDGALRCDLHPRWSPDGRWICVDSAHTGTRMTYFLDVAQICGL
jgi:hypothetical protein